MSAASIPEEDRPNNAPFVLGCIRAVVSLALLVDSFVITVTKHAEKSTDEESQSLLPKPADGAGTQNGNAGYGSIEQAGSGDEEEEAPTDKDK